MARELLIDADVLVYESAHAAQKTNYTYLDKRFPDAAQCKAWCEENKKDYKALRKSGAITTQVEVLPESVCRNILRAKIDGILNEVGCPKHRLILSGDGNYRDAIAKTKGYKANRADTPKPQHYLFVRALVLEMGAELTTGIEADDALGIHMTQHPDWVICTIDKDLNMIPGRHYDWNKKIKYMVPEAEAQRWFLRQLLTGDTTDNIPGLPGMGEVKANKILDPLRGNVGGMWKAVLAEYNKGPFKFKDGTETAFPQADYLNEQGALLWIQRRPGEHWTIDHYTKEYIAR